MAVPRGYQQILAATLASSTGLTLPTGSDGKEPDFCIIHVDTQAVRYRDDGTAPTTAIGMRLPVGGELLLEGGAQMKAIRFIAETAGANLNVSYYRDA